MAWTPGDPACVRIVCNSELDPLDVATAKAAQWAMWQEWCAQLPDLNDAAKARLRRLHEFLKAGRMEVRVLSIPKTHPFELRYERRPEQIDFESCASVLTANVQLDVLQGGWSI